MVTKVVVVIGVGTLKRLSMFFLSFYEMFWVQKIWIRNVHNIHPFLSSVARLFLKKQEAVLRNRIEREAIARYWDPRNHPPSPIPLRK